MTEQITVTDGKLIRIFDPENHTFYHIGRDGALKAVLLAKFRDYEYKNVNKVYIIDPLTKQATAIGFDVVTISTHRKIYPGGVQQTEHLSCVIAGKAIGDIYREHWVDPRPEEIEAVAIAHNIALQQEDKRQAETQQNLTEKGRIIQAVLDKLKVKMPQVVAHAIKTDNRNLFMGDRVKKIIFSMDCTKTVKEEWHYDILRDTWKQLNANTPS